MPAEQYNPGPGAVVLTFAAGADRSAATDIYEIVDLTAPHTVDVAGAGVGIGIQYNLPENGDDMSVGVAGPGRVRVGAAGIADGAFFSSDAAGRAIAAPFPSVVLGRVFARAGQADPIPAGDIADCVLFASTVP